MVYIDMATGKMEILDQTKNWYSLTNIFLNYTKIIQ